MNRILPHMLHKLQIKPQDIVGIVSPQFLDEAACRYWVLSGLHPSGPACPHCGARLEGRAAARFWAGKQIKCERCGRKFTARTKTVLADVKIGYQDMVFFLLFSGLGYPLSWIASRTGVQLRSLYNYQKRFF